MTNTSDVRLDCIQAAKKQRVTIIGFVLLIGLALGSTACGDATSTGGSGLAGPTPQNTDTDAGSERVLTDTTPTETGESEPGGSSGSDDSITDADGDDQSAEESQPERLSSGWAGPDVLPLAEAAIAKLGAPIGQPYSADAVVAVFAMPDDFLAIDGVITGMFEGWELDTRDGDISQEMIVGTDTVLTMEDLRGLAMQVSEDESFPWKAASTSDGGTILTGLYTSRTDADPVRRLVLQSYLEPDSATAPMNWELEISTHTEVVAPAWVAGLPIPDGGVLTRHSVGTGQVKSFGTTPGNGLVSVTYEYPVSALSDLEAYFATDVLQQAGFLFEDTPFNNQRVRIDLSIEDWSGTVSVWEGSSGGEVTRYGVTWTLSK